MRLAASGLGVALVPVNMVPDHLAEDRAADCGAPIVRQLAAYARTQFSPAAAAFAEAAAHRPRPARDRVPVKAPGSLRTPAACA